MSQVTPDWQQILDWHPKHKNVVVGAGFSGLILKLFHNTQFPMKKKSGSGFKLGPVTGEVLAEMLLSEGRGSKYDLKPFSADR